MQLPRMVSLVLLGVLPAGCGVYLHNPKNQTTAEAALKDFQAFRDKSGNPYAVMLKNLEKAKDATAEAQRAAAARHVAGYALGLPYRTWGQLGADLERQATALAEADKAVGEQIDSLADELKVSHHEKETLGAAKAALAKQFEENQRWLAQQALFKQAIQKIAEMSTARKSDLTPAALEKAGTDLLDTKISVPAQTPGGEVTIVDKKIRDVIGLDLPRDPKSFADLVKGLANIRLDVAASPGIAVTILGLAVDLASAEYRRAQVQAANLKRRADILGALKQNIDDAKKHVSTSTGDVATFPQAEAILASLESRRRPVGDSQPVGGHSTAIPAGDPAAPLSAGLRALARASVASTLLASERLRLDVELASLDHEYSIQVSAINAQAHEALIGRGLEGLAAYHRGGVTPEEIANVIRAAQAVAVGVIGGRL